MKTASEIRDYLAKICEGVRSGNIDRREADTMANLAGKIILSARAQIEYYSQRGETPKIEFLEEPAQPDEAR